MPWTTYNSPLGTLTLVGTSAGLRNVYFPGRGPSLESDDHDPDALAVAIDRLARYFAGDVSRIDVTLALEGTPFQRTVWGLVGQIPYGQTTTYGELASRLAPAAVTTTATAPTVAQAVARAIAQTPTPIVIPCHRVIGADGSMKGYLGGIARKEALLRFEAAGGDRRAFLDDGTSLGRQLSLALK